MNRPLVFLDADVIFAGAAAPTDYGASHVILVMGEITLLSCVTSQQVITEVERNLSAKLPAKLETLRRLVRRCLTVLPDPSLSDMQPYAEYADTKDLPILTTAITHGCRFLLTFNTRDYYPPPSLIAIHRPGEFLATVRALLASLAAT